MGALRLMGGGFFDGRQRPVTFLMHGRNGTRPVEGVRVVRTDEPHDAVLLHGVPSAPPARAVFDAIVEAGELRAAVVVVDMALAARLVTKEQIESSLGHRRGSQLARQALSLSSDRSRSPRETLMRLTWIIDAGLPPPLVNPLVVTLDGRPVGTPDQLETNLGVAGEYDGAAYRGRDRHRRDEERREAFLALGLEVFVVVAGDSTHTQVARMHAACARASRNSKRSWGWRA